MQRSAHHHAVLSPLGGAPWAPPQKPMDSVVLGRLAQGMIVVNPIEPIAPISQPVGPRDQERAVSAVAHVLRPIRVQYVPVGHRILAHARSDLDDRGALLTADDLKLLP